MKSITIVLQKSQEVTLVRLLPSDGPAIRVARSRDESPRRKAWRAWCAGAAVHGEAPPRSSDGSCERGPRRVVAPCPCLRAARGCDYWRRPRARHARAHNDQLWPPLRALPIGAVGGDVAAVGHTRRRGWRWRRTHGAHSSLAAAPMTGRRAAPRPAGTWGGGRGEGGGRPPARTRGDSGASARGGGASAATGARAAARATGR